jgi:hypothetical protein
MNKTSPRQVTIVPGTGLLQIKTLGKLAKLTFGGHLANQCPFSPVAARYAPAGWLVQL